MLVDIAILEPQFVIWFARRIVRRSHTLRYSSSAAKFKTEYT